MTAHETCITYDPQKSLADYVGESIQRCGFFEGLQLDFCCGGMLPLIDVCEKKGLSVQQVLSDLQAFDAQHRPTEDETGAFLATASLSQLSNFIYDTHHVYLYEALPRLSRWVDKVAEVHGPKNPNLLTLQSVYHTLQKELLTHLFKEENVLFPYCKELDTAEVLPPFHCGHVSHPVEVMRREHDDAGEALRKIRALADHFQLPEDACNTYRALMNGLQEMEADLHRHIYLENNVLFPKALEKADYLRDKTCDGHCSGNCQNS